NAPHDPIQPPPEWLAKVRQREPGLDEKRAKLVALIEHLDDGIGRVVAALDRLRLAENTLVIFTSDNGGFLAFGANNGPWRSGKTHLYEGGLRVPGVARWPGKIKPNTRTAHVALSMDIFPTLCEAAGVTPPADIDGLSFLPTLLGRPQRETHRDLYFVLREGGPAFGGKTIEALIRGPWKLIQDRPTAAWELYHLQRDPAESTDLAGKERAVLLELSAALREHIQLGGQTPWQAPDRAAACPPPLPQPRPKPKR
ncbi:MAG: sulfatase-like hydrolase/transferase, partial [Thermoguttaceae bacterium]|nr:sulfatase-like hydrolase/transferase [Thermoguttaceae bacterium]